MVNREWIIFCSWALYLHLRAWLYPCEDRFWVCTTEADYWKFMFHVPGARPDWCKTWSMGTSAAQWQSILHFWRAMDCQLPKVLVSIHLQTSSACQSTTVVSGMILASLGRVSSPMAISVALLTNTTRFSIDHHHLILSLHFLGRSPQVLVPLDSVPLGKITVIGMVSIAKYFWTVNNQSRFHM